MSTCSQNVRALLAATLGIGLVLVAATTVVLWWGGWFSMQGLARALIALALVGVGLGCIITLRMLSVGHVRAKHTIWRRADRASGYSLLMLLLLVVMLLLACGEGIMYVFGI